MKKFLSVLFPIILSLSIVVGVFHCIKKYIPKLYNVISSSFEDTKSYISDKLDNASSDSSSTLSNSTTSNNSNSSNSSISSNNSSLNSSDNFITLETNQILVEILKIEQDILNPSDYKVYFKLLDKGFKRGLNVEDFIYYEGLEYRISGATNFTDNIYYVRTNYPTEENPFYKDIGNTLVLNTNYTI